MSNAYCSVTIRGVPFALRNTFNQNAGIRQLSQAQYLASLVGLHECMKAASDQPAFAPMLEIFGLQEVRG